jgi:cell division protein YceG involved in septum cleavage
MMTKQTIRAIALGMLFATSVIGAAYYMEFGASTTAKLHDALKKEGLIAISVSEYKKLKEAAKQDSPPSVSNNQPSTKTVYVYFLTIQKGEVPNDFAQKLKDAHIISDANAFVTYLETHGLTRYVHAGTYKVHSGMSYEEIGNLITNRQQIR